MEEKQYFRYKNNIRAFLQGYHFLIFLIIFPLLLCSSISAQVVIKEKIKIGSGTSQRGNTSAYKVPGSGSSICGYYPQLDTAKDIAGLGGLLKIYLVNNGFIDSTPYTDVLWLTDWAGNHIRRINTSIIDTTDSIGGHYLMDKFYVNMWDEYSVRLERYFPDSTQVIPASKFKLPHTENYWGEIGFQRVWADSAYIDTLPLPPVSHFYKFWAYICLTPDSNRIGRIPIYDGPPYSGGEIIIPHTGKYRLKIKRANSVPLGSLVMTEPKDSLIVSNVGLHYDETFLLGPFERGSRVRIALRQGGSDRYPCVRETGMHPMWELAYSAWEDLDFNNLIYDFELADYPVLVNPDIEEAAPGDTARINLKLLSIDGDTVNFSQDAAFLVELIDSVKPGRIVNEYSDNIQPWEVIKEPFWFIADTSRQKDTLTAVIRVTYTEDQILGKRSVLGNNAKDESSKSSIIENIYSRDIGVVQGVNETLITEHKIMLGETQYFGVKRKVENGETKLQIAQIPTEYGSKPTFPKDTDGWTWIEDDNVWGEEPIKAVEGDKCGVYWEKKYPVYNGNSYKEMKDLDAGMIRLIGRYWAENSTYKVKLNSSYCGKSIQIVVIRPDLLGNSRLAKNLNNGIDIKSKDYSIDSICIRWGGLYGFPPHFIKGQYVGESVYDVKLQRITPGYRYEAWTTEFEVEKNTKIRNGHFWITWNSMGDGEPVPPHENTRYMKYVNDQHSVWYFVDQYSNIEHSPSPGGQLVLGERNLNNNKLIFKLYSRPRNKYNEIRKRIYLLHGINPEIENAQANEESRIEFIRYMKNEYYGGLVKRVAQSRVASSFGPIQPLYGTVLEYGYSTQADYPPERLNDLSVFWPFALDHFKKLLGNNVGLNANNWSKGFEGTLIKVYQGWNPGFDGYGANVLKNGKGFLPIIEGEN